MITLLTLVAIAILALVFARRIDWGLGALIFLLPFERIGAYPLNLATGFPLIRPSQVVGAALILAASWRIVTRKDTLTIPKPLLWLVPLLASLTVSAYLINYGQLWRNLVSTMFVFTLCAVVAQLTKDHEGIIEKALFASAFLVCLFGLYQYLGDLAGLPTWLTGLRPEYTRAVFGFPRIQSTALEPLYFANYLLIPLFWAWTTWITTKSTRRLKVALLISLVFLLTMSRGAFIGAAIAIPITIGLLLWHKVKLPVRAITASVLLGSILVLSATAIASEITLHNLSGPKTFVQLLTTQLTKTGSFTERIASQEQARIFFTQKPFFGLGVGGFGPRLLNYPAVRPLTWPIANNAFWELLAEMGLIGFAFYVAFLLTSWLNGLRSYLKEKDSLRMAQLLALLAAIVAIFIQAQSFSGFFLTHIWVALGLLIGLSVPGQEKMKK